MSSGKDKDNKDKEPAAAEAKNDHEDSDEEASGTSNFSLEFLGRYLATKLKIHGDDKPKEKILEEFTIDGIVSHINKNNCNNIIVMAGAGISTTAGIPDFRSPVSGLYHNLQKYNLPHPQAIFELSFFHENPRPFFELAKELYPGSFKPTICHYFVKLLNDKGMLLRHYTQNIDTLERVAGVPDEKLVEAHGTFNKGHCLACRKSYTQDWMKDKIFADDIPPICDDCPGVVKPDIVFFGENLPEKFHKSITTDFSKCDLLIIMGSSLTVQPFASLIDRAPDGCPRLLINREKAGHQSGLSLFGYGGGLEFDRESNVRDVCWLGDCDEGCLALAEKLGWGDELKELRKQEHERIDKDEGKTMKKDPKL
ncbi:Sir2 family [Popillia japonica]|uniref:NAD-dependent protein deacetylase n=1 Tax=Popillia japonica TaxID=7064 RepID=A0AAW1JM11_POPJA